MLGYFGPEGTFTHQALLKLEPNAAAKPYPSVPLALAAARAGEVEASVVPIENSVEGGVSATLDYLAASEPPLHIIREIVIEVSFDLAVRPGTTLGDVRRVITHPHAAAQVRGWLAANLPNAELIERGSTAAAAEEVANPDSTFDAAVCAPVAREMYGLEALAHNINDNDGAVTRFVLVARADSGTSARPTRTGHDKTTFVAYMRADHSGALLEILQQLAVRGVNLCRIESRPTKTTLGSYCFSIDAEGHLDDARVAGALQGLKRICADVVFLGSYPRADEIVPNIPHWASEGSYAASKTWLDSLG
ncbi:MAG: prephenate dehydratase [Propionibacteriaceae bacterium]|jgi:prephenate dehydratase|nr:prephenate dehydratase [Propionibacteriaceae bacterium]